MEICTRGASRAAFLIDGSPYTAIDLAQQGSANQFCDYLRHQVQQDTEKFSRQDAVTQLRTELVRLHMTARGYSPKWDLPSILKGKRILLAEDHLLNQKVVGKILEKWKVQYTCVENGQEALEAFQKSPMKFFDAILMDIHMPVMDGLEAAERIRATGREDAAAVPIIAITSDVFSDEQTSETGINAQISKPISPQALRILLVHELIKRKN